ncbi:MAG: SEL1-like repeat protein [Psychrobacter alimentarius]
MMYFESIGINKNYDKAIEWFQNAAEQYLLLYFNFYDIKE